MDIDLHRRSTGINYSPRHCQRKEPQDLPPSKSRRATTMVCKIRATLKRRSSWLYAYFRVSAYISPMAGIACFVNMRARRLPPDRRACKRWHHEILSIEGTSGDKSNFRSTLRQIEAEERNNTTAASKISSFRTEVPGGTEPERLVSQQATNASAKQTNRSQSKRL